MKRNILTLGITMISVLLFLASCGKEEGGNNVVPDPMFGNITDPAWSVSADYDYTTSMTAVISVDLQGRDSLWTIDTADRVAAFVGDECVGLANPSGSLFFLFIVPPQHGGDDITLRYYSSYYRNIFRSDTVFSFSNGSQQGTVSNPFLVVFSKDIK
ncbi:MAG: hypothetical protein ACSW8I_04625 [bacterium]